MKIAYEAGLTDVITGIFALTKPKQPLELTREALYGGLLQLRRSYKDLLPNDFQREPDRWYSKEVEGALASMSFNANFGMPPATQDPRYVIDARTKHLWAEDAKRIFSQDLYARLKAASKEFYKGIPNW